MENRKIKQTRRLLIVITDYDDKSVSLEMSAPDFTKYEIIGILEETKDAMSEMYVKENLLNKQKPSAAGSTIHPDISTKPVEAQKRKRPAVIIYHRDIYTRYKKEWVDKSIESIRQQTHKDFDVFELNYGNNKTQIYQGSQFFNEKKQNFIEAMNYLLDLAFEDYDVIFNVNLDDWYAPDRFELQLAEIEKGADLVGCDFRFMHNQDTNKEPTDGEILEAHKMDIAAELAKTPPVNIICHPAVCYTKRFWQAHGPYNIKSVKYEDMELWQKALKNGAKIHIVPKVLCWYRTHSQNTGRNGERE